MLEREPFAGATKTGDDFIRNEQDSIFIANRPHQWEIIVWRNDHAADTHHRFGDKCRYGVCTFTKDRFFEGARRSLTNRLTSLQFTFKSIWVWRGNMNKPFDGGTKHRVIFFKSCGK